MAAGLFFLGFMGWCSSEFFPLTCTLFSRYPPSVGGRLVGLRGCGWIDSGCARMSYFAALPVSWYRFFVDVEWRLREKHDFILGSGGCYVYLAL